MTGTGSSIDRRQFLGGGAKFAVAASGLGVLPGTAAASAAQETARSGKAPAFIIDSHVHCGGTEAWVQEMVQTYRPRRAMACILTWRKDMDLMKKAIAEHPDVFIGYGRIDLDNVNAIREVET